MDPDDEVVLEDPSKTWQENLLDFLHHLVTSSGVTKAKKLSYLNALVTLWADKEKGGSAATTAPTEDGPPGIPIRLKEVMLW